MTELQSLNSSDIQNPAVLQPFTSCVLHKLKPHEQDIDFSKAAPGSGGFLLLDLNYNCEVPEAILTNTERLGERTLINFYTGPLKILAIGSNASEYGIHIRINEKVQELVKQSNQASPVLPGVTSSELNTIMQAPYVAGFRYGPNILVRIEDKPEWWRNGDEVGYLKLCERYREAVEMAKCYAHSRGGTVQIQVGDDFGISITKTINALHLVSREQHSDERFLKRSRQYLPEGTFYYSLRGTRYKSIEQFERDLFGTKPIMSDLPEECFPRYKNRDACLSYLSKASVLMHPSRRNQASSNKREAQFLLLHPGTETLVSEDDSKGKYEILLGTLHKQLANLSSSQEDWITNIDKAESLLRRFSKQLKDHCALIGHTDDYNNPRWIEIVSSILNGSSELHIDKIALGNSFHTPLEALDAVFSEVDSNGVRRYALRADLPTSQREIIGKALQLHPEAHRAHWFTVCQPKIPLTEVELTPSEIKKYEDYEDDSLVILYGSIHDKETRLVARTDPFHEETWRARRTDKVAELLRNFSPSELTSLAHRFKNWQSVLFNRLLHASSQGESRALPPFEVRGKHLIREFLDGKVCSRMDRNKLPFETISEVMRLLGPVCASYYLAQRPTFAFHELLLDGTETSGGKLSLLPIGTSETFCNRRIIRQTPPRYREDAASLYGAHVASWIASFLHGRDAAHLNLYERKMAQNELLSIWGNSFRDSLLAATRADLGLEEIRRDYQGLIKEFHLTGRDIPSDFNFLTFLPFTKKLLASSASEIDHTVEGFMLNAKDFSEVFNRLIGPPNDGSSFEERERLNIAIYSILNNHLNTEYAKRVERFLYNRIVDLDRCSISERECLINLFNVTTRLSEIVGTSRGLHQSAQALVEAALKEGVSAKEFCSTIKTLPSNIRLSHAQAESFYTAIRGLASIYLRADHPDERERMVHYTSTVTCGLINFFHENGKEEWDL